MVAPVIIGAGLQAGGALAKNRAAQEVTKKRNALLEAEGERQAAYQGEIDSRLGDVLLGFNRNAQDNAYESNAAERGAFLEALLGPSKNDGLPMMPSASNEARGEVARQIASAIATGKDMARRRGRLMAGGATQLGNNITLGNSRRDVDMIRNFSAGSSAVLGAELDGAKQAGYGYQQLGDILSGAGSLVSNYGMTRPTPKSPDFYAPGDAYMPAMTYYRG